MCRGPRLPDRDDSLASLPGSPPARGPVVGICPGTRDFTEADAVSEMTCEEYRERVAGDVDGREDPESRSARAHADACPRCRALRDSQMELRALLRSRDLSAPAPPGLKTRILARLERDAEPSRWSPLPGIGRILAGAVVVAVFVFLARSPGPPPDAAHGIYVGALEGGLPPAVELHEVDEIEAYYASHVAAHGAPTHVVDLEGAGFRPLGVRIVMADAGPRRLTYYSDGRYRILCDYRYVRQFSGRLPEPGRPIFFRRDGLNFCMTRFGDEVCVLITTMPLEQMAARLLGWI